MKFYRISAMLVLLALSLLNSVAAASDFEGRIINRETVLKIAWLIEDDLYDMDPEEKSRLIDKYISMSREELRKLTSEFEESEFEDERVFSETMSEIMIKNNKIRIDSEEEGQKVSYIFDSANQVILMIRFEEKVYSKIDLRMMIEQQKKMIAEMQEMLGMPDEEFEKYMKTENRSISLNPAGKTKTINGFECDLYSGSDENGTVKQIWLSKKAEAGLVDVLLKFMELSSQLDEEGDDADEISLIKAHNGIPILTAKLDDEELTIDEIIEIKPESIPDTVFEIPADFKEMVIR